MSPAAVRDTAERLAHGLEAEGFAGWDPYDALSSPVLRTCARTRLLRGAAVQAVKRSPVNVRPLLGIRKRDHTKALALLASGYATLARLPYGARHGARAVALGERLADRARPVGGGLGFAYDFDVQTRWGYYPAGRPNAVVTAFAAHALLDVAELGERSYREAALRTLDYACSQLLVERGDERFFGYFAGSATPIHNASLLVASVAARLPELRDDVLAAAADAVAFSVARQRPDGSWPYGEGPRLGWVDGFHTAYVLEALGRWQQHAPSDAVGGALERGLTLYLGSLFDPDGAPRASRESRYPIDVHAASSAVTALCRLRARLPEAFSTAGRVLAWTLGHMLRPDGRFAFQRHARYRNATPYVRWSDAHMLLALAAYLAAVEDGRER